MCKVNPPAYGQRYCLVCKAAYMREYRKTHPLTGDAKFRNEVRLAARAHKRAGRLIQQPCEACGNPDSQMHHPTYNDPLKVRWFCVRCHHALHKAEG